MTIAEDGPSTNVKPNANSITRRRFLGNTVGFVATVTGLDFLFNLTSSAKAADSSNAEPNPSDILYDLDYYKNLYCGNILNLSAARGNRPDSGGSYLTYNASQARLFSMKKDLPNNQKEMAELLAREYTNLALRGMVWDIPLETSNPDAITLENLVKLEIAKSLTTNGIDQNFYDSMGERYESALKKKLAYQKQIGVHHGEISKKERNEVMAKILDDFSLAGVYSDKKHVDLPKTFKFVADVGWTVSSLGDIFYLFEHSDKPNENIDKKSRIAENYSGLVNKVEDGMADYVNNSGDLGSFKKIDDNRDGERRYEIRLNSSGILKAVMRYSNNASSYTLEEGRYLNLLCNMVLGNKKKLKNRAEFGYYANILKMQLGWREIQDCLDKDGDGYSATDGICGPVDCDDNNPAIHPGATEICNGIDDDCDGSIDEGVKNTYSHDGDAYKNGSGDRGAREKHLAGASARALSAFLLVANNPEGYEAKLFSEMYKQYTQEMDKCRVSKDLRTEANSREAFLFYLTELNDFHKRNTGRLITIGIKGSLGLLLPCALPSTGVGSAAAGGGVVIY